MKRMTLLLLVAALTACGPSEPPKPAANVPTVDELAADPERLKELRRQCKTERQTMGDVLCNRVAEATNKRFFGDGKVPYTPSETPPKF
ncbi:MULTISPECIES: EexN family lipoprotein [Pseudomonadota]|uniref:EexN family lipoprotein n=1 Tax=Pseudomonadota TaxID=1224 RepID=UPI001BDEFB82|nr:MULTISPECIES: EexN family lipoprotein [Pseudomonadota]MBT1934764.1 EexN family lipoprotein [Enterobacter chengduensis]MBT1963068.1 EexN family lipoprotein [Enterobacter chengduensis]MDH1767343.1 EexN family lipoprotein [Comamonas aquatica]